MADLTPLDRRVLAFEHRRYRHAGARDQAILDEFGMSITTYSQALNALIDRPEALVYDPVLVKRLRRLRQTRREARRVVGA